METLTEPAPLWLDFHASFQWGPDRTIVYYERREPREHFEPIEDEL